MKTGIFVDAPNLYYGMEHLFQQHKSSAAEKIDHKRFIETVCGSISEINLIIYYLTANQIEGRFKKLVASLESLNIDVRIKLHKHIITETGGILHKANCDVEIAVDAMDALYLTDIDHFVIVSGDSDFVPLAQRLIGNRKDITVVASKNSLAYEWVELKNMGAINIILLDDIFENIIWIPKYENADT